MSLLSDIITGTENLRAFSGKDPIVFKYSKNGNIYCIQSKARRTMNFLRLLIKDMKPGSVFILMKSDLVQLLALLEAIKYDQQEILPSFNDDLELKIFVTILNYGHKEPVGIKEAGSLRFYTIKNQLLVRLYSRFNKSVRSNIEALNNV